MMTPLNHPCVHQGSIKQQNMLICESHLNLPWWPHSTILAYTKTAWNSKTCWSVSLTPTYHDDPTQPPTPTQHETAKHVDLWVPPQLTMMTPFNHPCVHQGSTKQQNMLIWESHPNLPWWPPSTARTDPEITHSNIKYQNMLMWFDVWVSPQPSMMSSPNHPCLPPKPAQSSKTCWFVSLTPTCHDEPTQPPVLTQKQQKNNIK